MVNPIPTQLQTGRQVPTKLYQAATQGGSSLFHFILEDVGQVIPIYFFWGGGGLQCTLV